MIFTGGITVARDMNTFKAWYVAKLHSPKMVWIYISDGNMRANILHVFELASVSKCLDTGADIHRSASVFPNTSLLVGGCGRHFCFQYDNTTLNPPEIYGRFFLTSPLTDVVCPGEPSSLWVFSHDHPDI